MSSGRAAFSDAELVQRLMLVEQCNNNKSEAARRLGTAQSAFVRSIQEAHRRKLTAASKVLTEADKWKTKAKMLEQELAATTRHNISVEEIRKTLYNLSENIPDPPAWPLKLRKGKTNGVPMSIWSDWHYGELVNYDEVGGVNVFNAKVAEHRVQTLVNSTIHLCMNHMGPKPKYDGFVLCLGGDMISGEIHEELRETNEMGIQKARTQVEELLIWGISQLADHFGRIFIPCVVGNHGRTTRKPRAKHRVYDNHDFGIYLSLERHFRNDKRVRIYTPAEPDAFFTVAGHRFLLTHGDAIGTGGGDGIIGALGPITRGTIKIGRQQAQVGRDFDTAIFGHWHQYIPRSDASRVIVNGALKGYDEYANAILRALYARPSQALWFVHPSKGITAQWPIYLEEDRRPHLKAAPWVQWQERVAA